MRAIDQRLVKFVLAAAAAGAALLLVFLVLKPPIVRLAQQRALIREASARLESATKLEGNEQQLREEYSRALESVRAASITGDIHEHLLSEIGRIAEENGVHIEAMRPLSEQNLDFYVEYPVRVDIEANLGNIVGFLYDLKSSGSLMDVRRVMSLRPKAKKSFLLKGSIIVATARIREGM